MTGPSWLPVAIPIVALVVLFGWLAAVYYADGHPGWNGHTAVPQQPGPGAAGHAGPQPQVPRQAASPEQGSEPGTAPAPAPGSTVGR